MLNSRHPSTNWQVKTQPYKGVRNTVKHMRQLAGKAQSHPRVREAALRVVREVSPKDFLSELAAIYYDTCRRFRYIRDPAEAEMIHHPAVLLERGAGDCDDMALYLQAALRALAEVGSLSLSVGNDSEYVVVGFDPQATGDGRFSHVFLRANAGSGQWLVLDPVAGPYTGDMLSRIAHFQTFGG